MSLLIQKVRKNIQPKLLTIQRRLEKKFSSLKSENSHSANDDPLKRGSKRIHASQYIPLNDRDGIQRTRRKHKTRKSRTRQKLNSNNKRTACENDLKAFDPIVLAQNVKLTPEQIRVCRLPDCFAPTPREPVNVADQVIGTHAWAERLRWRRFFYLKNQEEEYLDLNVDASSDEEFVKKPWYKPTSRMAPKGDPALEAFITACSHQFMDPTHRRRIRDNMTSEERTALHQLKQLPVTHNAACRYADKAGVTVITSLTDDDIAIKTELYKPEYYDILDNDPTKDTTLTVKKWVKKWLGKGAINEDIARFVTPDPVSRPGKIKPLVKTHKAKPFPYRYLLSGSGTPTQPLSKFVQQAICHLTKHLTFQVLDTKELLQKLERINENFAPLPDSATFVVCDVVSLFPNVDNKAGIPAVKQALKENPGDIDVPRECIMEALDITLNNNCSQYTDGEGVTIYARPNHGTAMGPCHACEYVDVFMGTIDDKVVENCPVPLLSDVDTQADSSNKCLDWTRYRDDGITILLNAKDTKKFEQHLQSIHPPNIKWTVHETKTPQYLDLKLSIKNGYIQTDVNSKHCHSYLPKSSCHPPSVFRGLLTGVGTRLRMLCSEEETLTQRLDEYAHHFSLAGWPYNKTRKELEKGANKNRREIVFKDRKKKDKKIAWVTQYDPRVPAKSKIIKDNLHILYAHPLNKDIFPKQMIIAAERKRKNISEIFKPTVPNRFPKHGPQNKSGFFPCDAKKCDTCSHSSTLLSLQSPWDGRMWRIKQNLSCKTPNVIYILRCRIHPDKWYVGSTKNLKLRWANHKSDVKLKKIKKCAVAKHVTETKHPDDPNLNFLSIHAIESVEAEDRLLNRETYWMANLGTIFTGLNKRTDICHSLQKNEIRQQYEI